MTYSTNQVAELSGVTIRVLQWWDERHIVSPQHEGHSRIYTRDETVDAMLIATIRRKGVSLQRVRRIMERVRRVKTDAGFFIVVSGIRVSLFEEEAPALSYAATAPRSVVVIEMESIYRRIHATEARLRREAVASLSAGERKHSKRDNLLEHELRDARRTAAG